MNLTKFESLRKETLALAERINECVSRFQSVHRGSNETFRLWENIVSQVLRQLNDDIIRVAVVGTVKSGKSTFVNSFLGGDFLKRGAGIITSIITRVRPNGNTSAKLLLKTWNHINKDIMQALGLFPSLEWKSRQGNFDIRNTQDRRDLKKALAALKPEQIISQESKDWNSVLLSAYLEGYDSMKDMIKEDPSSFVYDKELFDQHKNIVGSDALSIYLQDILLTIPSQNSLLKNLEISDCQGSDSPNPMHLAMIQNYLVQAHQIIYVITSRVGIRQADIRFLNLVNEMRLLKNALVVVNCDLGEHETLEDLKSIVGNIQKELSHIHNGDLPVFSFSALYNLLKSGQLNSQISEKNKLKISQWTQDHTMPEFSDAETERFLDRFSDIISQERFSLLIESNVERLGIVASGLYDLVNLSTELLRKNSHDAQSLLAEMRKRKDSIDNLISIVTDTLKGAHNKLKKELGKKTDHFFDPEYGDTAKDIYKFIKTYNASHPGGERLSDIPQFWAALYSMFQEFQQALNRFLAESINVKILNYVSEQEIFIKKTIEGIGESFNSMIRDVIHEYQRKLNILGPGRDQKEEGYHAGKIDIHAVKHQCKLNIPIINSDLPLNAQIKTEALVHFGVQKMKVFFKTIFKKPVEREQEKYAELLRHRIGQMKRSAKESIAGLLVDYKENLKFQYLYKLTEAVLDSLFQGLAARIHAFTVDLAYMEENIHTTQNEKKQSADSLQALNQDLEAILKGVRGMGEGLWIQPGQEKLQ
ncbi:MAG: dynamin family protein [Pseudomonadota bacterium]